MTELIDNTPTTLARQHPPIWLVYQKTRGGEFIRPDRTNPMDWTRVTWGIDGFDNKATIRVALRDEDLRRPGETGIRHIGDIIGQGGILHPDLLVRIFQPSSPDEPPAAWLFEGYPMLSTASWTENTQSVEVSCISAAHELLRHGAGIGQQGAHLIVGRRMSRSSTLIWKPKQYQKQTIKVQPLAVHFNAGGRPNRSPFLSTYKEKSKQDSHPAYDLYLFTEDDRHDAEFWNYADALRYLVWWHIIVPGIDFDVSAFMADTDRLVGKNLRRAGNNQFDKLMLQRVADERVDAMSVEHAIRQLVNRAGLHYSLSIKVDDDGGPDGGPIHYLRVFPVITLTDEAPSSFDMGWPERHHIPREAPFTPLDLKGRDVHAGIKANAVQQATITLDDHLINRPVFIAGIKFYEVTLLLVPGWLPFRIYEEEGYKNYPGLEDVPSVNVLDDVDADTLLNWDKESHKDQVKVIKDYWEKGDPVKAQPTIDNDGVQTVPWQFDKRHPEFEAISEVGRKWIFPTGDRYASEDPLHPIESLYWRNYGSLVGIEDHELNWNAINISQVNRMVHPRFGGIPEARDWVSRERPFGSPMSRFPGGKKLAMYLEFKIFGSPNVDTNWLLYTGGPPAISATESAITIDINNPINISTYRNQPNRDENWFIWIARQELYLRVTCLVEGDDRLNILAKNVKSHIARNRYNVIDLGERFRWRDRGSDLGKGNTTNSILARKIPPGVIDPEFETIDESGKLEKHAIADATILSRQTVSGDPEIPWIAYDIGSIPLLLGDMFIGAPGVGLDKFVNQPELVNISYENSPGGGYRTKLSLSDLRSDPTLLLDDG